MNSMQQMSPAILVIPALIGIVIDIVILTYLADVHKECKKDPSSGKRVFIQVIVWIDLILAALLLVGALIAAGSAKKGGY